MDVLVVRLEIFTPHPRVEERRLSLDLVVSEEYQWIIAVIIFHSWNLFLKKK